jgi:hypothetical protein
MAGGIDALAARPEAGGIARGIPSIEEEACIRP